ncbi:MAG: TetR/AcrR family transcriptional regulator [Syntrophobacteraceae bacterium]|nr:TetR/AcrR family transcriptional regulator [Syntrophobacteraceae bacterium]
MHTLKEKETLRSLILSAARELFVEEGYRNVSMRKIARKIGYSATTIYLYFKNKGELVNCLAEEMLEKLVKVFQDVQGENLDPVARLKKMGEAYVRLATEDPNGYRVAFMMETDLWSKPEDYLKEGSQGLRFYQMILNAVEACVKCREPRREEVEAAAQAVFAAVHGLVALWLTYPAFPWASRQQLQQVVIDSAVGGIVA